MLKKELPKILKTVKGEDRVMLVGISTAPFEGDVRALTKLYQKVVLIPRPDYASRHLIWRQLIIKHGGGGGQLMDRLDVSSLSKISDGYTAGMLNQICSTVLTEHRLRETARPLQAIEFLPSLAKVDPIFTDEEQAFKTWYQKTPLGKKHYLKLHGGDDGKKGKGKGKKDGKKKGKKK